MYRSIKRLFKRLRRQRGEIRTQRLSDHRTVEAAVRMARYMAKQDTMLAGSPLARAE